MLATIERKGKAPGCLHLILRHDEAQHLVDDRQPINIPIKHLLDAAGGAEALATREHLHVFVAAPGMSEDDCMVRLCAELDPGTTAIEVKDHRTPASRLN